MPTYIPLKVHSEYSLVKSILSLEEVVEFAHDNQLPAIALTDSNNLLGCVKFQKACLEKKIKPIVGIECTLGFDGESFTCLIYVKNQQGWLNLLQVSTYLATIDKILPFPKFIEHQQGLILVSSLQASELSKKETIQGFFQQAAQELIGNFYIGIDRSDSALQSHEQFLLDESLEHKLPILALNGACFLKTEDHLSHEIKSCIVSGEKITDPTRVAKASPQAELLVPEKMQQLFADIPEALENTLELSYRCNFLPIFKQVHLPRFPTPENIPPEEFIDKLVESRLSAIAQQNKLKFPLENYQERLKYELSVIKDMGFVGYFLIVYEFIAWAKQNSCPVGPGRGSGAGSLVAYLLEITDVDPLAFDLLFERFLNKGRKGLPDIDIDFCGSSRDKVIQHIYACYGEKSVSQIVTFNRLKAKAVLRDVTRSLGKPYALGDKLARLVPNDLGISLEKAYNENAEFRDFVTQDEEAQEIFRHAIKLENLVRGLGVHAGGVVIADKPLSSYSPLILDADGQSQVTQFDKDDLEEIGLVKFDLLGVSMLTCIDQALAAIDAGIKINEIGLDDPKVYELISTGEISCIFQLDSSLGIRNMIKRMGVDSFEELFAVLALYRPGPLNSGMADEFIERKQNPSLIQYPHPDLQPVLQETFGVLVYQEQIMKIAQIISNFSLEEADDLRKAMGKKKGDLMEKYRKQFIEQGIKNNHDPATVETLAETMREFAEYGFNKSHSVSYALLTYQSAWLKCYYPTEFMLANLNLNTSKIQKLLPILTETTRLGITIKPPHINISRDRFHILEPQQICYGLMAIKGIPENFSQSLVKVRESGGKFNNFIDFLERLPENTSSRVIQILIKAGACDGLGLSRAAMLACVEETISGFAESRKQLQTNSLFDEEEVNTQSLVLERYQNVSELPLEKLLDFEREVLGRYISGHPTEVFSHFRQSLQLHNLGELEELVEKKVALRLVAEVLLINKKPAKKQSPKDQANKLNYSLRITDFTSSEVEASLFGVEPIAGLKEHALVCIEGNARYDSFRDAVGIRVQKIYTNPQQAFAAWMNELVFCLSFLEKPQDLEQTQEILGYLKAKNSVEDGFPVRFKIEGEDWNGEISESQFSIPFNPKELLELQAKGVCKSIEAG